MYSIVKSGIALGVEGMLISVEADISAGLPVLTLVGYLSSSVKEAGERVRTALKNSDIVIPPRRITINLSPANLRKEGTGFDLAIAVSILCSMQVIPYNEKIKTSIFLGELGLDGSIKPINGVLPIIDYAAKNGIKTAFVSPFNSKEASYVGDIAIVKVNSLKKIIEVLCDREKPELVPNMKDEFSEKNNIILHDFCDVKGQKSLKRGIEIAVAGFHNIIMTGAAGAGKSMLASCIPGIMPNLTYEESMTLTKIYSVSGYIDSENFPIKSRPFRNPHHTISEKALIGGGIIPTPGEVSLANHGVLFLDEFPEFKKQVLETLRQPMEDGRVTISRVHATYTFPADFMLVAAMNPCPCGHFPDRNKCTCTIKDIQAYQGRISYPIMDRIDIRVLVQPVTYSELFGNIPEENSEAIKNRIEGARRRQKYRFKNININFNSQIPQKLMGEYIKLEKDAEYLMKDSFEKNELSARGYYRIMRLSRTIADINDHEQITKEDVSEAIFYRNKPVYGEED